MKFHVICEGERLYGEPIYHSRSHNTLDEAKLEIQQQSSRTKRIIGNLTDQIQDAIDYQDRLRVVQDDVEIKLPTPAMCEGFITIWERGDGQHFGIEMNEPPVWRSVFPEDLSELAKLHYTYIEALDYVREQIQIINNKERTS